MDDLTAPRTLPRSGAVLIFASDPLDEVTTSSQGNHLMASSSFEAAASPCSDLLFCSSAVASL